MYANCHLCRHSLGANSGVPHMPIGARLAYDVERGRLWVVCPRCGEWNLTPLEERWEAIEECERLVETAPVRASSANVGLSHAAGVELVRIGPALRDELANWRYGPRLRRRRRRANLLAVGAGSVALGVVGGVAAAGAISSGPALALWGAGTAVFYGSALAGRLGRWVGPHRDVRVVSTRGDVVRTSFAELRGVTLTRVEDDRKRTAVGVRLPVDPNGVERYGNDALLALGAILPRLNWRGASPLRSAAPPRCSTAPRSGPATLRDRREGRRPRGSGSRSATGLATGRCRTWPRSGATRWSWR